MNHSRLPDLPASHDNAVEALLARTRGQRADEDAYCLRRLCISVRQTEVLNRYKTLKRCSKK